MPEASRTLRVVAIDDDPAGLGVIEQTLGPLGYEVQLASSGLEGIELAKRERADLVISDLLMPCVEGFEVVGRLHEATETASIPILVLTALELSTADRERLNGRVAGIVTKGQSGVDGLTDWLTRVLAS
jgi:threonine synthase